MSERKAVVVWKDPMDGRFYLQQHESEFTRHIALPIGEDGSLAGLTAEMVGSVGEVLLAYHRGEIKNPVILPLADLYDQLVDLLTLAKGATDESD